ncbi:EAL domain-containing protein [Aliikangiella sp. IMCC44359]|uniref:EAL domain-containing protein n=1 Tax=Aliikangiella sp. IMCC44359 TaxID=3459125 RepID=UPI00403AC6F3
MRKTSSASINQPPDSSLCPSFFEKQQSLEALLDFVIQINKLDSIEDIVWHLAHHTIKALNFEDCIIYLLDKNHNTLIQAAAYGPKNPIRKKIKNPISIKLGQGIVGKAAKKKKSILITDTRKNTDYIIDDKSRLSELTVPITFKGKLLGVIDSENSQLNFFTHEHQRYLEILASVLASKLSFESNIIALEKTILALEESNKLTELYLEISNLTYSSKSEKDLYQHLHQLITKQVKTQSFFITLYDKRKDSYSFPYFQDEHGESHFDLEFDQTRVAQSLVAQVIQTQHSKIANFEELQALANDGLILMQKNIPYSWLAAPFKISENLAGSIALQSYEKNTCFTSQDKTFLNFLAQHISTAIERKFKDKKLEFQALHDQVTGLANRNLFLDRIEHAFSLSERSSQFELAVLFIDFDDFKLVNDNFGHHAGDLLLLNSANLIQSQLRDSDTLARLGGDEFAVLLESLENTQQAVQIAQRILEALQEPFLINEQPIKASISIGISFKDENTASSEELLRHADHAMYHAKNLGKNNIQIYEISLHQALLYERKIQQDLIEAVENQQLEFYYQPIVDLKSGKVKGFEALTRWKHPIRGLVSPNEFIPIAEQTEVIKLLDEQLLKNIGQQLQAWQKITQESIYISINISAQRFVDSKLVDDICDIIEKYQLNKSSIVVEVTEHILMENKAKARHLFHQLKLAGIRISLDDFGTGYSSLSYLNQLPFDILKIDRSFVTNITEKNQDHPIINMIVALAKTMKIDLVAEGVETPLQLSTLLEMNCQYGQGYYFSKPIPAYKTQALVLNRQLK